MATDSSALVQDPKVASAPEASADHELLHHHFDDLEQQRDTHQTGMWVFLVTEVMMFGGLFLAYSVYRWLYPGAFSVGSGHLNETLGAVNTGVLLVSSLMMALAVHAAAERRKSAMVRYLILTWVLGVAFLGIKAVEWGVDYNEGLMPGVSWHYYDRHPGEAGGFAAQGFGPQNVMLYFVLYFLMTGLHAFHMILGLLVVGGLILLGSRGAFTDGNDQPVELVGLYWHFVDIVWVFLFPLLYLIHSVAHAGGH